MSQYNNCSGVHVSSRLGIASSRIGDTHGVHKHCGSINPVLFGQARLPIEKSAVTVQQLEIPVTEQITVPNLVTFCMNKPSFQQIVQFSIASRPKCSIELELQESSKVIPVSVQSSIFDQIPVFGKIPVPVQRSAFEQDPEVEQISFYAKIMITNRLSRSVRQEISVRPRRVVPVTYLPHQFRPQNNADAITIACVNAVRSHICNFLDMTAMASGKSRTDFGKFIFHASPVSICVIEWGPTGYFITIGPKLHTASVEHLSIHTGYIDNFTIHAQNFDGHYCNLLCSKMDSRVPSSPENGYFTQKPYNGYMAPDWMTKLLNFIVRGGHLCSYWCKSPEHHEHFERALSKCS